MAVPTTLRTRKPIVKLTATDLRRFPVWEFALDEEGAVGQDETWVRPVECAAIRGRAYSQIVATDFVTPAGRKLQGFMIVTTAEGKVEIDPGAVVGSVGYRVLPRPSRQLAIKHNAPWVTKAREQLLAAVGESETNVFPLRYSVRVPIRGERKPREGVLK